MSIVCGLAACSATQRIFDAPQTLGQTKTAVVEFFLPGSEAFARGKQYLAEGQLRNAVPWFEQAKKKAPKNEEFAKALSETKSQIVREALAQTDRLPLEDVPGRISLLREVSFYDDSQPSIVLDRIGRAEAKLNELTAEAKAIVGPPEIPLRESLERFRRVMSYAKYVPALETASIQVAERRPEALHQLTVQFEKGGFQEALSFSQELREVFPGDKDIGELHRRITNAIAQAEREKRERAAAQLRGWAAQAEAQNHKATALFYYRRALALAPGGEASTKTESLGKELEDLPSRSIRMLFSDMFSKDHRQQILALANAEARSKGVAIALDVTQGDQVARMPFVVEVELRDFQWRRSPENPESVWSSFKAGFQRVPNPAYTEMALKYQQAHLNYQRSLSGTGLIGAIDMIVSGNSLKEARNQLGATPQYLEEPVYQPYSYVKRVIREQGKIATRLRLVDWSGKQVLVTEDVEAKDENTQVEIKGAHPEDKGGAQDFAYPEQASVERFEKLKERIFRGNRCEGHLHGCRGPEASC